MNYDLVYYGGDMPKFVLPNHYEKNAAWAYLSFIQEGDSKFPYFGIKETGSSDLLSTDEMDEILNKHYVFRVVAKRNTEDDVIEQDFTTLRDAQYLNDLNDPLLGENYTSYIEYAPINWSRLC